MKPAKSAAASPAAYDRPKRELRTVLHVDDEAGDRELFKHATLRAKVSYQVSGVAGYYEAIDYLRGHDAYSDRTNYPIPALDYDLTSFRGTDLLKWLRSEKEFAKCPVAMLSGTAEPKVVAECYELGAKAYVTKPNEASGWRDIVLRFDSCLNGRTLRWSAVREISVRAALSHDMLIRESKASGIENRQLREKQRDLLSHLDLTMAELKEARKKFPYPWKTTS